MRLVSPFYCDKKECCTLKDELLIPLVGTVIVAGIAGAISLAVTILAKDQKISEFRQLWIDELRNDVSKLAGILHMLLALTEPVKKKGGDYVYDFAMSSRDHFVDINNLLARIRLRLNVNEHTHMLKLLKEIDESEGLSKKESEAQIQNLVTETQVILKGEWGRVKRGERSFQVLKWTSAILLVAGIGSAAWYFFPV